MNNPRIFVIKVWKPSNTRWDLMAMTLFLLHITYPSVSGQVPLNGVGCDSKPGGARAIKQLQTRKNRWNQ